MEVRHTRLVHDRLLDVSLNVLDEHFRPTRGEQVLLMRIELN